MDVLQKSNALCLKRKLVDDCLTKDSRSRHSEVENVSSKVDSRTPSFTHAHRCCIQPNLANDCVNYLKSTVPSRVVFYKEGSWCNFPEQIVQSLVDAFKGDKSSVVVVMDDQPLLVDFLSMTLVNLKTKKQHSVAWIDGAGKWFFPSVFFDEEADESTELYMSTVEGSTRRITGDKAVKSPSEVLKQVVFETIPSVPQNSCTVDILRKKIVPVERGSESFMFVQKLFLSGMGPFAMPNSILHIHHFSPKHITAQCRLEAFERQIRLTSEKCGAANARYGWLGSRKQDIVRILMDGFVSTENTTGHADLDAGSYLSPENRTFTSVGLCDVDENGVQYMLLCRAILGNMGTIKPGSPGKFPSTEIYDSGADNCSNPSYYLIWTSHLSTHICLEYLISFRLAPKVKEYLGQKGLWFHPPPKQGINLSTLQPIIYKSSEGPTSPWISFKVLFETIQGSISSVARELLFLHHEELKENKITREEMVKKMMIIVGEKLLVDSLTKLNCSPSLWYKSTAKVATDTINTAVDSICMDTTSRHAPSATRGYDSLGPSVVPVKCEPIDSTHGGSPLLSVALKRLDFPSPSMSLKNSSAPCPEGHDPFVPVMGPTNHSSVPRHNSVVSRSTPENSESLIMKGLHSVVPSTTPEVLEPLPTGIAPENSSYPDAGGSDTATSGVSPQFESPSMLRQFCARSMAPHLRVPSMVPHLRVSSTSKMPQVHVQSVMLQAQHSDTKTRIPVSCTPPLSSEANCQPPGLDTRAKAIHCAATSVALKSPDSSAILTTEGQKDSTLKNVMSSNLAAHCGANKKMPIQGVDASGTVTLAADALVSISTL